MKTTITILGLLAASLCMGPTALACGPYVRDEVQIRNAIFHHSPYRGDLRVDDLVIDGDRGTAIVSWSRGSGDRVESRYVLGRRNGVWHVDGFTYQVPAGTFRSTAAARRR